MHLDRYIISKCVAKFMHKEKPKRLIICDAGSTYWSLQSTTVHVLYCVYTYDEGQ